MNDIVQAMRELAAADCHCASCARTASECPVREKLQRLPVSKGGLNECKTRVGGYLPSEDPTAVSELNYRYRSQVQERNDENAPNPYDAYRLAVALLAHVHDDTTLEIIASELDYDPCQLQSGIVAIAEIVKAAL